MNTLARLDRSAANSSGRYLSRCQNLPLCSGASRYTLRFHLLTGDRRGTYSVTVKANWRVTFRFHDGAAREVNLEDYH